MCLGAPVRPCAPCAGGGGGGGGGASLPPWLAGWLAGWLGRAPPGSSPCGLGWAERGRAGPPRRPGGLCNRGRTRRLGAPRVMLARRRRRDGGARGPGPWGASPAGAQPARPQPPGSPGVGERRRRRRCAWAGAAERAATPPDPPNRTGPPRPSESESPTSQGGPRQARKMTPGRGSRGQSLHSSSEVEKDSGFSDVSSEYLSTLEQTDTEDQSASSLHRTAKLQRVPPKASRGVPGSTFAGLAPVYIVKNLALKQPLGPSAPTQFLAWSNPHRFDGLQGPPAHLLLIQQPLAAFKPLLPRRKPATKEAYPARLGNYPKIAPHPGLDRQSKAGPEAAPAGDKISKKKRFCLEEARVSSSKPATPERGGEERGGEPPLPPASSAQPAPAAISPALLCPNAVTSSTDSGTAGLGRAEARMISRASRKLGFSNPGKQRRFHNTVEILRKSGLLGITLRTKELIRQSSNTQRDLAELREQTQLLCQAVQSNDPLAWTRLQEAMHRSASYWASKGAAPCPPWGQSLPAQAPDSLEAAASPPSSPMNLSLMSDASLGGLELP